MRILVISICVVLLTDVALVVWEVVKNLLARLSKMICENCLVRRAKMIVAYQQYVNKKKPGEIVETLNKMLPENKFVYKNGHIYLELNTELFRVIKRVEQ